MRSLNRHDTPAQVLFMAEVSDDAPTTHDTLNSCLGDCLGGTFDIAHASCAEDACDQLKDRQFDLIILDLEACNDIAGGVEGIVGRIAKRSCGGLIIALSQGTALSDAMAAMRAGAHDYIAKPVNGRAFAERVRELADRHGRPGAVRLTPGHCEVAGSFHGFVGNSPQMRVITEQILRIAPSTAPVFISGESGSGKSLCAEALHASGPRAKKPLIAVNCGAIPRDLMETELFGVAKGAYTGASADQAGAVEQADGGTLFLDDIEALDLSLQARLMRLLQTQTVSRNGEGVARSVDVRIVAATRSNLIQLMSQRRFREDLFYRLHVLPIHMPPLRQRPMDILPLAGHFLDKACAEAGKEFEGFSLEVKNVLGTHELPGNARQLQNLMQRIAVLFDGGAVTASMLRAADVEITGTRCTPIEAKTDVSAILPMWRQEQNIIESTITLFKGNISQAAAALEISPSTIYRKRQSWEQMVGVQAGAA